MQPLLDELIKIRALLTDLVTIGKDLITTTRFQRGGYDGPFLRSRQLRVPPNEAVEIHTGGASDMYGGPRAIVIECTGTGNIGDVLYIGDDRAALQRSFRLPIHNPISIATGNAFRVMADRNQRLYALATLTGPSSGEPPFILVHEGKA